MQNSRGFTLIEVLVSMLVLALGLLGLSALQVTSLRNNQSAFMRSQATQLAYDIADRMRANSADSSAMGASTYVQTAATAATVQANCQAIAGSCSSAQMAQQDLFEWNENINAILPLGQGSITVNGSLFIITINWDDDRDGSAADTSFQMSFQL